MNNSSATLAILASLFLNPGASRAADPTDHPRATTERALADALVGTWELVSYKVKDKDTGALIDAMGTQPRGRVVFTKDGWVAFNLEGSHRQPPTSDADRAELMRSLVAYIGRYRIEGDQWVTNVQTAWTPEWVGTEQRRTVELDGDYADVTTPWRVMPNWDAGHLSQSIIRFKRAR